MEINAQIIGIVGDLLYLYLPGHRIITTSKLNETDRIFIDECIPTYSHEYFIELSVYGGSDNHYVQRPITEADKLAQNKLNISNWAKAS